MRRIRSIALITLVLGIIVTATIIHSIGWNQISAAFTNAHSIFIGGYILTSLLIASILTLKWKIVLDAQEISIPYRRLFAYRTVGYSIGYLTPTAHVGGEPIRAFLLKQEGVSTDKAFSAVIIDKSIELMSNIFFFSIGVLLIINSVHVSGSMKIVLLCISFMLILMLGIFIGGVLGPTSMFVAAFRLLKLDRIRRLKPIEKNLAQVEKHIEFFYRRRKQHFLIIAGLMILLWMLMYFEYKFALLIIGHDASLLEIFLILTGVGLAYAVPIPAAMGALELGQLSAAKVLDLSSATGIALAVIIRMRDIAWTALGLLFISIYQFSFTKLSAKTREIDRDFEQGELFRRQ